MDMKKIALGLVVLTCLACTTSAQNRQKTKTKQLDKQGAIMSDSPNTIAPAPPADRTGNNNNTSRPRTDPGNPTRNNPNNNNTNQQNQNSLDNEPLNRNNNNRDDRTNDMNRNTNDMMMNNSSNPPTPPPPVSK
jgi:hypothetical protein